MGKKDISTLVDDIYSLLESGKELPDKLIEDFGKNLSETLREALSELNGKSGLRFSNIGTPCARKLWYIINMPDSAEPLKGYEKLKFLIGHVHEEMLLMLAEASGHSVTGRQTTLNLNGIVGHRDAIIDGVMVDVKSASPFSFKKFQSGLTPESDGFGYIDQIGSYAFASKDDELLTDRDRVAFLVSDKSAGYLCLDVHPKSNKDYESFFNERIEMTKGPIPERGYSDESFGSRGNRALGFNCQYCQFRKVCWEGLRAFNYSNKIVYLTVVKSEPKVEEIPL